MVCIIWNSRYIPGDRKQYVAFYIQYDDIHKESKERWDAKYICIYDTEKIIICYAQKIHIDEYIIYFI